MITWKFYNLIKADAATASGLKKSSERLIEYKANTPRDRWPYWLKSDKDQSHD